MVNKYICYQTRSSAITGRLCHEQVKLMELDSYSRPTYNKLVHSVMTRLTVVGVIHKLTVDEFVDNTCTLMTCCGQIF